MINTGTTVNSQNSEKLHHNCIKHFRKIPMECFYFLLYVVHFMKHLKLEILTRIEVGIIFGFVESHITLDFFCLWLGQGRSEVNNCVKWWSFPFWSCLDEYSLNKGINFARCHLNGWIDAAKLENVQCARQHEIVLVHIVDDVVDKLKKYSNIQKRAEITERLLSLSKSKHTLLYDYAKAKVQKTV